MAACFDVLIRCLKSSSTDRKFYQQDDVPDERGIEYDRLIEMPDPSPASTPRKNEQLILNERERHLISNKLYSEYAEDQDRYDRLKEDELLKEEKQLAMKEEELYSQKASKIREFYQTRPLSSASESSHIPADPCTYVPAERFTTRVHTDSCAVSRTNDYVSDSANCSATSSSCTTNPVEQPSFANFDGHSPVSPPSPAPAAPSASATALSCELSAKLLDDIDDILADKASDGSDHFYPGSLSSLTDSDCSTTLPAVNPAEYHLTTVVLDSSPSPAFVTSEGRGQSEEGRGQAASSSDGQPPAVKFADETNPGTGVVFDPFEEFKCNREKSGSQESFVEIGLK